MAAVASPHRPTPHRRHLRNHSSRLRYQRHPTASETLELTKIRLPASALTQRLVRNLTVLYGMRDLFVGLAVYAAAKSDDEQNVRLGLDLLVMVWLL